MTSHRGEGIHGEGYDHWDRLGKASVPSTCGVEGRPAGVAQEGVAGTAEFEAWHEAARGPGVGDAARSGGSAPPTPAQPLDLTSLPVQPMD
jgi:hypothetical protein